MKKSVLHAALFALTLPMSLYALGLGNLKVESSLDQPFKAEIELIDIGSASLATIKVGLADPENFERVGIERALVLDLLHFKIEKNAQGQFVIKIESLERMTEPYMELVVDIAWPNGQLYKAYTVLLDPPGYQLVSPKVHSGITHYKSSSYGYGSEAGVVNKTILTTVEHNPVERNDGKEKTTYGPTVTNENVWQIAQRYKTSEVILPQVVLAIVGANPEAFSEGNLNGLKVGVRLKIPATKEIENIPADLATQEVMAHDKAWNEKTPINHVLTPPYIGDQPFHASNSVPYSEIPAAPKFASQQGSAAGIIPQLVNAISLVQVGTQGQLNQNKRSPNDEQNATTKAEIAITTAAVESVRESNALLMEQLHIAQEQNKKLQQQLDKRDKDIELLRTQMQVLMKERLAVASQASSSTTDTNSSSSWPLYLLLLAAIGGGGFAFWYFKRREQEDVEQSPKSTALVEPKPYIPEVTQDVKQVDEVIASSIITDDHSDEKGRDIKAVAKESLAPIIEEELKPIKKKSTKKKKAQPIESEPVIELGTAELRTAELETPSDLQNISQPKVNIEDEPIEQKSKEQDAQELIQIEQDPIDIAYDSAAGDQSVPLTSNHNKEVEEEEQQHENSMLEFESGLHQLIQEKPILNEEDSLAEDAENHVEHLEYVSALPAEEVVTNEPSSEEPYESAATEAKESDTNLAIDADLDKVIEVSSHTSESVPTGANETPDILSVASISNPLKSKKALDTLLSLAQTYIGMDDFESAKHSLDEVMEHGSDTQKEEAHRLLDEIKGKY